MSTIATTALPVVTTITDVLVNTSGATSRITNANAKTALGVPAAANPTASVGTSAVNGSAATFLRSDGAPAISQSIVPTWSGLHTFTGGFSANVAGFSPIIGRADGGTCNLFFDSNGRGMVRSASTVQVGFITDALSMQLKSDVTFGWNSGQPGSGSFDTALARDAAKIVGLYDGTVGAAHGGYFHYPRVASDTDPAAPTDGGIVYSKIVGGKNGLFVRFPTGAVQQIAIEP